jgi:hypothetical protein
MNTTEIPREDWIRFFDDFSKKHETWIVRWEVLGQDLGDQEKTVRLPLVGISADSKLAPRIDIMVGGRPEAHVTQIIENPRYVRLREPDIPGHEAIEVETDDGRVTLLTFDHIDPDIEDRLLPPKE